MKVRAQKEEQRHNKQDAAEAKKIKKKSNRRG